MRLLKVYQTSPIKYSTAIATTTTSAEMINPCSMGAIPDLFISLKLVLSPIAASAEIIRNLLTSFIPAETAAGMTPRLLIAVKAKNPRINQGKILRMLKFALRTVSLPLVFMASFFLM